MSTELIVALVLIGLIAIGMLIQKPARRAMIRRLANLFVDVFEAHCAKEHTYQRGPFEAEDPKTQSFYQNQQAELESAHCQYLGDTENISLRPILPGGGYFQKHFISDNHELGISIFHLSAKQRGQEELVHGRSVTTFFNTGTVISSISVENDHQQLPDHIPSQMIYNVVPFELSINEFLEKHRKEVNLYLDNREDASVTLIPDLETGLRLANEKQRLLHDHIWDQGDPIDEAYIRKNLDPRFDAMVPEIKSEIDRLLDERDLRK